MKYFIKTLLIRQHESYMTFYYDWECVYQNDNGDIRIANGTAPELSQCYDAAVEAIKDYVSKTE